MNGVDENPTMMRLTTRLVESIARRNIRSGLKWHSKIKDYLSSLYPQETAMEMEKLIHYTVKPKGFKDTLHVALFFSRMFFKNIWRLVEQHNNFCTATTNNLAQWNGKWFSMLQSEKLMKWFRYSENNRPFTTWKKLIYFLEWREKIN